MIAALGLIETMSAFGVTISTFLVFIFVCWLGYCIHSVARAADALERIADALEEDDEEEDEGNKAKGADGK